jgi:hypothetical protein
MNNCLPTTDAQKHYILLSGIRRDKSAEACNAGLRAIRSDAASRGILKSGLTYSAEADLSASSVDELTKGLVEDAIATCNLYGIELTRERCACIEQAAHSHLAIQKQFVIQSQNRDRPEIPHQAVEALQAKIERTKFSAMREISVLIEKARVEDTTRRQAVAKQASSKPPQRFAVGTKVRVCNPGIDGVVTHMNEERTAMSEYWHGIRMPT